MEKISRCPFCGSTAYLTIDKAKKSKLYYLHCKCTECGAQGRTYFTTNDPDKGEIEEAQRAIAAWNRRT